MSSRADIAAGRGHKKARTQAVDIEAPQSPTRRRLRCPSVCTVFWFAIAAMFAGLFGWAYTRNIQEAGGIDITADATCSADKIALHMPLVAWAQHPNPPMIFQNSPSILESFVGRNFLAVLPGSQYVTGKIGAVDGLSFTPLDKQAFNSSTNMNNVSCTVTLDESSFPPLYKSQTVGGQCQLTSNTIPFQTSFTSCPIAVDVTEDNMLRESTKQDQEQSCASLRKLQCDGSLTCTRSMTCYYKYDDGLVTLNPPKDFGGIISNQLENDMENDDSTQK